MFSQIIRKKCILVLVFVCCITNTAYAEEDYAMAREKMVQVIKDEVRATSQYLGKDALDARVLQIMATVPREQFVPDQAKGFAYDNRPLSIGHGQTISQPYIVAIMSDLLELKPDARVLELGTGSGYQAAILSGLVSQVFSIEIVEPVGLVAKERLKRLGYENVTVKIGDGYFGWEEHAPFDAIIVTAAAKDIPPALKKQLKVGGRLIIPVDDSLITQQLMLLTKQGNNKFISRKVLPVRFVPVTGKH